MKLSRKALLFFGLLFLALTLVLSAAQVWWVNRLVFEQASNRMRWNIRAAWRSLELRRENLERLSALLSRLPTTAPGRGRPLADDRTELGLDVLTWLDERGRPAGRPDAPALPIPGLEQALATGEPLAGFARVPVPPLLAAGYEPRSGCGPPVDENGLLLLFAMHPGADAGAGGAARGVLSSLVLNCREPLVDEMRRDIFGEQVWEGREVGTATVFLGPMRIATTVRREEGERAIGTLVSREVADQVLGEGRPWTGRAWVVNDWYLSRYEPIRNPAGEIVGMLYIGELEAVHEEARRGTVLALLALLVGVMAAAVGASWAMARPTLRQIEHLDRTTRRFARGDLAARVSLQASDETGALAASFNAMADELEEDRRRILEQKQRIETLNLNYLDMLGFVTHELRSTLGSALFNIELIQDGSFGEFDEELRSGVTVVQEALRHLDDITRNYLQLARIESGELVAQRSEVQLVPEVIEPVIENLAPQLEERRMRLDNEVPRELVVPADATLLRVVYENLVGNAVKYGSRGGRIVLDAHSSPNRIELGVTNEGEPIPADRLPTLFGKFQRYDVDQATGRRGSGLGLFIVRQIAVAHGGDVAVTSRPGQGTRFIVTLHS